MNTEIRREYLKKTRKILQEVNKTVVGKDAEICTIMMAILARGHILIEDIPGVGKTTVAMAFAKALGFKCNRIQFTPDVMPSDIIGYNMYNKVTNQFEFKEGAVNCNILLADEINRTSPKTQSALLQVMEEGRISVDGKQIELPQPFVVMATQNPHGSVGTQKLPESQLDRFMIKISLGYPKIEDEIRIMKSRKMGVERIVSQNVVTKEELVNIQKVVDEIYVDDAIYDYVARISKATRNNADIIQGISTRGSIAIIAMSKAVAFLRGHDYVLPSDVLHIIYDTVCHRIVVGKNFKKESNNPRDIMKNVIQEVDVPEMSLGGNEGIVIF